MPEHPLFSWWDDAWVCTLSPDWVVRIERNGQEVPAPLGDGMTLPWLRMEDGLRLILQCGPTSIEASLVYPATVELE